MEVPSLYVRVYRRIYQRQSRNNCSLTIREGVSGKTGSAVLLQSFPHYT